MRHIARWIGGALALCLGACVPYATDVQPVEDEIIIKLMSDPGAAYDHPQRFTVPELTAILKEVQVQYKAGWLQNLLAGREKPLPLFDSPWLPRIGPELVRAFEQATPHDRIVFYVAERRSDVRREVTGGALFVTGRLMHIVVSNFKNGVDVVPGIPTNDRAHPEIAVSPQRFTVMFEKPEFIVRSESGFVQGVFGAVPPGIVVDYWRYLNTVGRQVKPGSAADAALPLTPSGQILPGRSDLR
jgi:hypothetical protein